MKEHQKPKRDKIKILADILQGFLFILDPASVT
jgi:hypothetical protein